MARKSYIRFYDTEIRALMACNDFNQSCRNVGNYADCRVMVDGPDGNFAVVDIDTAIEAGFCYKF